MADDDTTESASLVERARTTWATASPQRRGAILAAVAVPIVVLGWFGYQATRPEWRAVAHGMLPEDQQAAVAALDAAQIPHRLEDAGTIVVAEDDLYRARMELAASTMGGSRAAGFELFDKSELGRSSFNEKVNYHRALEGELARTVQHLSPVERARVHLVLPERRLFEEDQAEPTASVVVSLRRGSSLTKRQVQAVRQLVASAVERLAPGQVSVADQSGVMLTRPEDDRWLSDEALEYQTRFEASLERRVVALLEPVFGHGHVRAQVAAELDFSRLVETEERFDPESQVVRSEREKLEKAETDQNVAAGAPGVASNVPDRAQAQAVNAPAAGPRSSEKSDTIKNYEIDKATSRRESPHARVDRISVAVVVDAAARRDADGVIEPPDEAELAQYQALVAKAIGADEQRGDAVEIMAMAFSGIDFPAVEPTAEPGLLEQPLVQLALGAALLLLLAFIALVVWLRGRARDRRALAEAEAERLEQERLAALEAARVVVLPEPEPATLEIQERIAALRERARRQTHADFRRTASVLRRWLRTPPEEPAAS